MNLTGISILIAALRGDSAGPIPRALASPSSTIPLSSIFTASFLSIEVIAPPLAKSVLNKAPHNHGVFVSNK